MPPGLFEGDVSFATPSCVMSEHPRSDARPRDQRGARWPLTIRTPHEDIRQIGIYAKGFTRTVTVCAVSWVRGGGTEEGKDSPIAAWPRSPGACARNPGKMRLDAYPCLTCDVIQAALGVAAEALRAAVVYPMR